MDFGHETVDLPMPIGLKSKMSANDLEFEILESAVV
jgi:muramoyltetrapeptide carboxypeptidase LdcA involved in peptidoglycan recycling